MPGMALDTVGSGTEESALSLCPRGAHVLRSGEQLNKSQRNQVQVAETTMGAESAGWLGLFRVIKGCLREEVTFQ